MKRATSCPGCPTRAPQSCARWRSRRGRRSTSRSWPTPQPSAAFDEAAAELRAAIRERDRRHDHVRLRPALPALHRPVSQGRAQGRALPAAAARRARGCRDPRRAVHVHHAQERPGDRRSADPARARPARRARSPAGRGPRGRAARADRRHEGATVTQIGFVGLGKMGGNMVHRIRRDSEHEVVAFDFDEQAVAQGGQTRRLRRELAEGPRQTAAGAAHGVDHGARRRPHAADRRCARQAARARRHDHRRRQLQVDRRQAPLGGAQTERHRLRGRRHAAAACGAWRSATA